MLVGTGKGHQAAGLYERGQGGGKQEARLKTEHLGGGCRCPREGERCSQASSLQPRGLSTSSSQVGPPQVGAFCGGLLGFSPKLRIRRHLPRLPGCDVLGAHCFENTAKCSSTSGPKMQGSLDWVTAQGPLCSLQAWPLPGGPRDQTWLPGKNHLTPPSSVWHPPAGHSPVNTSQGAPHLVWAEASWEPVITDQRARLHLSGPGPGPEEEAGGQAGIWFELLELPLGTLSLSWGYAGSLDGYPTTLPPATALG